MVLFVVYIPPNDQEVEKELCKKLVSRIEQVQRSDKAKVLIMEDFNTEASNTLLNGKKAQAGLNRRSLLQKLVDKGFKNTHTHLDIGSSRMTRKGLNKDSEIDYIWLSQNWYTELIRCKIQDMNLYTNSDHHMILAWLVCRAHYSNQSKAQRRRAKSKKICIDAEKIIEEDWIAFAKRTDEILKSACNKRKTSSNNGGRAEKDPFSQEILDREWDMLESSIRTAANKMLPKKRFTASKSKETNEDHDCDLRKLSKWLNRLCRKGKKNMGDVLNADDKVELEEVLTMIKSELDEEFCFEGDTDIWSTNTYEHLEQLAQLVKTVWKKMNLLRAEKKIRESIEERCERIVTNQKLMLNSILERPTRKVKIDRACKESGDDFRLFTNEKDVLNKVETHFNEQFRKRNFNVNKLRGVWKEQYKTREEIEEEWYNQVSNKITLAEWEHALSTTRNTSAPGISGITYPILKHIGKFTKQFCIDLMSKCLTSGKIPMKWKLDLLYPIPKKEEWNFNLNNVRPIVLLETLRKILNKVIMQRLDRIFKERGILKGPNFAGLSGESTKDPIHILSCITEEAREKQKEASVLFQDMQKAFDSVSMSSLELALKRIKMPENLCKYILNLYQRRQFEIITTFGNTNQITAGDGIDQGEVLSPLVWRIYYDPLLCEIQNNKKWGYEIAVRWPLDLCNSRVKEISWHQSVLAYADDTTWIAKSKEELEEILELADEFYDLNDIKINKKKTELLVINGTKQLADQDYRIFSRDGTETIAKLKDNPARILGVWVSEKNGKNYSIKLVEQEIHRLIRTLRKKKVSVGHLQYINNKVLIPRIEYRLKCHIVNKQVCDRLHRPWLMLVKSKSGLARSTTSGILHHRNLLGFRTIWQARLAQQITSLN